MYFLLLCLSMPYLTSQCLGVLCGIFMFREVEVMFNNLKKEIGKKGLGFFVIIALCLGLGFLFALGGVVRLITLLSHLMILCA